MPTSDKTGEAIPTPLTDAFAVALDKKLWAEIPTLMAPAITKALQSYTNFARELEASRSASALAKEARELLEKWDAVSQFAFDAQADPDMGLSKAVEINQQAAEVTERCKALLRSLAIAPASAERARAMCSQGGYCDQDPPCASPEKCARLTPASSDGRIKEAADKLAYALNQGYFGVSSTSAYTLANDVLALLRVASNSATSPSNGPLTLDTERQVFFYEQDHYYLSNFSAFKVRFLDVLYDTSEHAYQAQKFLADESRDYRGELRLRWDISGAASAHDAFKLAERDSFRRHPRWDDLKVQVMREILRAKAAQHEYVSRKLLQTGDRELVENSWRDPFWGWGPNRDGQNMLGKLWMEVRAELRGEAEGAAK